MVANKDKQCGLQHYRVSMEGAARNATPLSKKELKEFVCFDIRG